MLVSGGTHAKINRAAAFGGKMELNSTKTRSSALLNCGNQRDFSEKLLLKPKTSGPQTERLPRSSVLERLQSFLPQMAEANEQLKKKMEESPAECFDIENVEEAQRVIEMDVALVELNGSEEEEDTEDTEDSEEESDSDEEEREVTENNMKLPGHDKRKANIQVLST